MASLETFQRQLCSVMDSLSGAAVAELGRLLKQSSADVWFGPAVDPVLVAGSEGERDRQQLVQRITDWFASFMEAWTKDAVENILKMLKSSECQVSPAEQSEGLNIRTKPRSKAVKESVASRRTAAVSVQTFSAADTALPDSGEGGGVPEDSESTSQQQKAAGRFQCPSCDKTFALKCLMNRHFLIHSRPHLCSQCGKRFAALRGLTAHSRTHTGQKLHRCAQCGTGFAHKSSFQRHMQKHAVEKGRTHTCPACQLEFWGEQAFQRHRCCALKKTFQCSVCPETFQCRQTLANHENLHPGARDFVCESCGERFLSATSLAVHRVTHVQNEDGLLNKGGGDEAFTCDVCGKGCSHRSALKHHMLTHTGERPYVCETCGKRCSHASALQNHLRVHTGRKPGLKPTCRVCGKKFSSAVKLKYHMSVHTGEKPYACEECDKRFSNPSNLQVHRRIHSGERKYGCSVCGRTFIQRVSLKLHRRVHTGETPFHCSACGRDFLHRCDFRKHQRRHLEEDEGGDRTAADFSTLC
ncbi:hypothetical protein OJAV_G00117380 [Oryzias javanicus]|uniref:C2H2-type domain-containing protein n=1 Tax=Oryzias javanicus TaxID=123683 RepID=A0A3S2MRP1_ORYJA|nr:hypothetical protein OJAV_G00117380 [Oryzias javanicus]